jgi:mono/diheme cytochrome c family protein
LGGVDTSPRGCKSALFTACRLALAAALLVAMLASIGCGGWNVPPDAKSVKNPVPGNAATIAAAREIYGNSCKQCHGVNGDGKLPPGAKYYYSTKPTNFTHARIVDKMTDGEIFWKMTNGRKPMPAFKDRLSDEQRWELVNLIRVFAHSESAPAQK